MTENMMRVVHEISKALATKCGNVPPDEALAAIAVTLADLSLAYGMSPAQIARGVQAALAVAMALPPTQGELRSGTGRAAQDSDTGAEDFAFSGPRPRAKIGFRPGN